MLDQEKHSKKPPPRETVCIAVGIQVKRNGKFDIALVFLETGVVRTFYRDCTDPKYGASTYYDWVEDYIRASVRMRRCFSAQISTSAILIMSGAMRGVRFGAPEEFAQPIINLERLLQSP